MSQTAQVRNTRTQTPSARPVETAPSSGQASRQSNIELLRIVAMLMIVAFHIVDHCVSIQLSDLESIARMGNGYFCQPLFYKRLLLLETFMPMGPIANGVFILISGYFLAVKRPEHIRLGNTAKKLLWRLAFVTVVLLFASLGYYQRHEGVFTSMTSVKSFNSASWFVGYYFLVVVIGRLFLNRWLAGLDRGRYATFLLALFAILQFKWSGSLLKGISGGLPTLCTGVLLYSAGGFIRRYDPFTRLRTGALVGIIAGMNVLVWISYYNTTVTDIQTWIRQTELQLTTDPFVQSVDKFSNSSIVVIVVAFCLFEIFRRIRVPHSRLINYLGGATFTIYLLHDNDFFYGIWDTVDWIALMWRSPWAFLGELLWWTALTFAAGVLVDLLFHGMGGLYRRFSWLFWRDVPTMGMHADASMPSEPPASGRVSNAGRTSARHRITTDRHHPNA